MNKKISYVFFTAIMALLFAYGCADDRNLFGHDEPGEGEAMLTAEISFKNYTPALTRTSGNALNGIDNLFVFIYKENGTLVDIKEYQSEELKVEDNNTIPPSDGEGVDVNDKGELILPTSKTTTLNITLPYGKYQIYAAANIRGEYATALRDREGVAKTVDGLKSFKVKWDSATIGNDDQMFGYFMELSAGEQVPSTSKGFGPNVITINQPNVRIGAWLRRLSSKVTVAYDASGLNQGVWVYIKNVTVHDIAAECYLGKENSPEKADEVLNRRTGDFNQPDATYTPSEANTRITYPGKPTENIYDKSQSGIELYNGLVTPDGKPILKGSDHSADSDALFFYENMQGDFQNESNKADYDKRQHGSGKDQVGENVRDDIDNNDYKDRVKYGTYVEVEAYYVSINQNNPSQGPIKYRFMLGKDITYNYDVERNYHFKLTLGFKGWANQPDWHIDYDIPDPNLEVPPVYRVSYLYQTKSSLPVKISKNCKSLRVDIIENNWAPTDPNTLQFPSGTVSSDLNASYQFMWNRDAFDNYYSSLTTIEGISVPVNTKMPWLGFLALNMPKADDVALLPTTVPEETPANPATGTPAKYYSYRQGALAQNKLKEFYDKEYGQGSQGYSLFLKEKGELELGGEDKHPGNCPLNSWSVVSVDDGTDKDNRIVMVPLWTRAKSMIELSGFSGNNPYEYFVRKATLKVTAVFDMGEAPDKELTEYVTVLQEPRIVNPKAIWRKGGSGASNFHVVLMTAKNSNQQSDYTPLRSDGEWIAQIETGSNVSLSTSSTTLGEEKDGKIYGKTGSEIDFNININGDGCAIVDVLYHSHNCTHKIFICQGYEGTQSMGGKEWSNFTLESATESGTANVYNAVETKNPMILGSMFRRGRITEGILETNNNRTNFGPFQNPGSRTFDLTGGTKTWVNLGCEGNKTNPKPMGTFKINGDNYKVPELKDFNQLKENCEFAFGIMYGDGATETSDIYKTATGFCSSDPDPNKGVRCVIAYDAKGGTDHQIVFPLGKDGYGRRPQQYYDSGAGGNVNANGMLLYSTVWRPLTGDKPNSSGGGNVFRPVPYNMKITPGAVFWLNTIVDDGYTGTTPAGPTMSWDINYFNYDFNSFDSSNTNFQDACPIKLIKE